MSKTDLIIGRNPVIEALKSGRGISGVIIQKGASGSIAKVYDLAKKKGIKIEQAEKTELDKLCKGKGHQGVVAFATAHSFASMKDIYKRVEAGGENALIVILDELEDPHNLGAIMRSAECAGACGIIISKHNSCGLTETVAKTSAGAIEYMPCVQVTNIAKTIDELKKNGFWIAACDMNGSLYTEADMRGKLALVIGNEGKGIRQLVKSKCDFVVSIPMLGQINSLNASNAAAIIMYEALRQRSEKR